MASIDQQFIEFIVKTLVNNPDAVTVDRIVDERGVLLTLTVAPEDIGRVIGKRGATAQSIRTLLRVLGTKNEARYNLKIVNSDEAAEAAHASQHSETTAENSATENPATASSEEADPAEHSEPATDEPEALEPASDLAAKTRAELADLDDLDI